MLNKIMLLTGEVAEVEKTWADAVEITRGDLLLYGAIALVVVIAIAYLVPKFINVKRRR